MDWYYREDSGLQVGPLTEDEFDGRVKAGQVSADTMVWNESMHGWQSYQDWKRSGSSLPDAPPIPKVVCSSRYCQFPENEVLRYQDSWVCASCKPLFFQRLKEGGAVPGILEYASFWPRFGAKIIDGIITNVASGIIQFGAIIPLTAISKNESLIGIVYIISYLLALGMSFAYYVYFLANIKRLRKNGIRFKSCYSGRRAYYCGNSDRAIFCRDVKRTYLRSWLHHGCF